MSGVRGPIRTRFWCEYITAALSGLLFVVTLFWRDWLEAVGIDPDHGDGSVEWLIVALLLAISVTLAVVARLEWRSTATATAKR
jgi:tetrahydromethanopterin S-methyltransferase subunit E